VTTSCVPSAVPAADLRFGGVVGPSWFLRAAGDFPNDASEHPGRNTGRCGAGSVLQFVCCVFGVIPNAKTQRFGIWGVASTICNNLIADLLFLRKCHAPAQSLLRLGPRSWVFAPVFLKSKLKNAAVCPVRTAFGPLRCCMALRGAGGAQEGSGCTSSGRKKSERGGGTKKRKRRGML
jgi:hypothetical protein